MDGCGVLLDGGLAELKLPAESLLDRVVLAKQLRRVEFGGAKSQEVSRVVSLGKRDEVSSTIARDKSELLDDCPSVETVQVEAVGPRIGEMGQPGLGKVATDFGPHPNPEVGVRGVVPRVRLGVSPTLGVSQKVAHAI